MPADIALGPVLLQVADLSRSIAYYDRVLGLRVLQTSAGAATLGADDGGTPLVELRELRGAAPVPRRGRLGLYHFALLLPDRASLGRFAAHLASLPHYAGSADHLVSEALYLTDPDGLGIEVYADRPRSSWRTQGGALAMATDPLDLDDLVRAGGGQPWSGVPAGTRVGHIHLYVADLRLAAAFYHEALGLDRVVLDFPGALFLSAGGYHHHLGTNTWAAGAPPARENDARLLEWRVHVPHAEDVGAVSASLESAGYPVGRGPDGVTARDPWGTQIRISAR
ncbi:MAG TPA: VOC family protein [Gemmatimonadales bacterium]|nr:VOC family protein [Gemmatimonadales bacterium]